MTITRKEVLRIAKLARLALGDEEVERYRDELASILTYVDKLDELDLDGVEPTIQPVELEARLRDDEVEERLTHEEVLDNAPQVESGHFRVPRAVEE